MLEGVSWIAMFMSAIESISPPLSLFRFRGELRALSLSLSPVTRLRPGLRGDPPLPSPSFPLFTGPSLAGFFPGLDRRLCFSPQRKTSQSKQEKEREAGHYVCAWRARSMAGDKAAAAVRVLVVDDSPVDRKVVELLLRNHKSGAAPFHVTAVDSGKKAMELLGLKGQENLDSSVSAGANELTVDIVLTDYCMPEMTGYDLLKAIKTLSSPNPIPVIVMSSENEPQRISRCLTAGAEDFILKPLKSKDVQRLRNCSNARSKDATAEVPHCESLSNRRKPPSDQIAKKATSEQRPQLAGFAMVLNASSSELSHYFQYLFKFILLAYAVLCLKYLLHRCSNGSFLSLWCA